MQFIELDRFGSSGKLVQLEPVEALGATTGLFEERLTVRGSTSQMSAVASTEQPCPRHLTMRTTVSSGSLEYRKSVPCRSVNRCLHAEQYNLRICLCLPVHSTTLRLPESKWLK